MKVCNFSKTFLEDPIRKLNFELENCNEHVCLHLDSPREKLPEKSREKTILLDLELPNRCMYPDTRPMFFRNESYYDKILTIDPILCEIRNNLLGKNLYQSVFFPFNMNYYTEENKDIDVFYSGTMIPQLSMEFDVMKKFQHQIITGHRYNYSDKLKYNARSKISIVHNTYFLTNREMSLENITETKNQKATQHKARVVEAAFSKSIMLCKKDPFNIIENIFDPNKHFLYYETEKELVELIHEILNSYDNYYSIAEKAFEHAKTNLTTTNFVKRYIDT